MQHPVGYVINHTTHRAELKSIFSVLGNSTVLLAFPHTIFGAICTGGMLVLAISAFALVRGRGNEVYSRSVRMVLPLTLAAAVLTGAFGHAQGTLMETQQPMKMAAAEALYDTTRGASLSIFAVGPFEHFPKRLNTDIRIPHLLSVLGTASWNGEVKGVNQLNREAQAKYGPGDFVPIPLIGLLLIRRGVMERKRWFLWAAVGGAFLPPLANLTGWIFTEMGRQPWIVYGLLKTSDARSPLVGSGTVILSLLGYTLLYGLMLVIGGRLFLKEIAHGPEAKPEQEPPAPGAEPRPDLVLAY